jgi:hypothetical protein
MTTRALGNRVRADQRLEFVSALVARVLINWHVKLLIQGVFCRSAATAELDLAFHMDGEKLSYAKSWD